MWKLLFTIQEDESKIPKLHCETYQPPFNYNICVPLSRAVSSKPPRGLSIHLVILAK